MNNNYHSIKILTLAFFLFETYAQVPIQYYDFELNSDRTQVETTAEIIINSISGSAVTSEGGVIVNNSGNPATGSALRRDDWDENGGINPGVNAPDYIQFSASTSGFRGISVKADIAASSSFQVNGEINLLYSINGGSTFFQSSPKELSTSFEQFNWNLSNIPGLNNNSNVVFRLYGYGEITPIGNGTITIDNLYVSAERISESKTLGNYQLIDDANGLALFPVFNNFTVEGTDIIVNMESDLRFNGNLRLLNGILSTDSSRVVMQENSDLTGGDSDTYVAGSLSLFAELDDSPFAEDEVELLFPIGSLSGYHPVEMIFDDDDDDGRGEDFIEITVTQLDTDPFPASLPSTVDRISSVRFWRILSSQSLGDFDLTLHWAEDDSVLDMENLTIAYGTANAAWLYENKSGGYNGNTSSGSITGSFNGLQGDYTFGNLKGGGNPLPVELSTFNIKVIKDNAHLSWSTDTEINSYKFVVQRMSSEDMNWRNAGEVFASGNSNSPKHYSFTDINLEANFYSYRLKMIDNDGTFEYS
ncbi:MAG: hypothetical protein EHM47_12125, partial [Ignavibacteriales bacterium]